MTAEDCLKIPASVYSGHLTDKKLLAAYYGAMHGEDIWRKHGIDKKDWAGVFLREFALLQLPYFYLNRYARQSYKEENGDYTVYFSEGVISSGKDGRITKNGAVLKDGGNVLLPLSADNSTFFAYSENGRSGEWDIPDADFSLAQITSVTTDGNVPLGEVNIINGIVYIDINPGQAIVLRKINS